MTPKLREARVAAEKAWATTAESAAAASPGATAPGAGAGAAAAGGSAATLAAARESLQKAKSDPTVDLAKTSADLKAVASSDASDADKKAAKDLIAEIEGVDKTRRDAALAAAPPATKMPAAGSAGLAAPAAAAAGDQAKVDPAKGDPAKVDGAKALRSPAPTPAPVPTALTPSGGSRYAAVGWVSSSRDPKGVAYLRKGGVITFRLSCPDGRYRLSDFADREIGVTGKVVAAEGLQPMVEVESVEILRK
jgi:hypothetical protein